MTLSADILTTTGGQTTWATDPDSLQLNEAQARIAPELLVWLTVQAKVVPGQPAPVQAPGKHTLGEMIELEQSIIKHFSPLKNAVLVLQVLGKLITSLNRSNTQKFPLPRIPNLPKRPSNPFQGDLAAAIGKARDWRSCLGVSVKSDDFFEHENPFMPNYVRMGSLFASSVLHGGLYDTRLLVALCKSLNMPEQRISVVKHQTHVDLSLGWQGEENCELRRWQPDMLSAALMLQISKEDLAWLVPPKKKDAKKDGKTEEVGGEKKKKKRARSIDDQIRRRINKCVLAFFRATNLPKASRPKSLADLVRISLADAQTQLTPVLTGFGSRKIVSHALRPEVHARIHGLPKPINPDNTESSIVQSHTSEGLEQANCDLTDIEPPWLKPMRKAFASKNLPQIRQELDSVRVTYQNAADGICFIDFAQYLVPTDSARRNRLATKTAKAYAISVAKRLAGRLGGINPSTLDIETLITLYTDILEDTDQQSHSKRLRRSVAAALNKFHTYLVNVHGFQTISVSSILGIGRGLIPVDACIITPDEYHAVLLRLEHYRVTAKKRPELIDIATLIFILGFRCGLRRKEALKLQIIDLLCETAQVELLIRPWEERGLKTSNSTRKLPLYALLTEHELQLICDWKAKRLTEINDPTEDYLFGIPKLFPQFVSEDTLFPIIHDAMRDVIGDPFLRYHHLRHSFATWVFFLLIISDLENIPDFFDHLPITSAYLKSCKAFREKLYTHSDITRKHTYAIASLLGHCGPDISLEHYIHCLDWISGAAHQQCSVTPDESVIMAATRIPTATLYRQLGKHGHDLQIIIGNLAEQRYSHRLSPEMIPVKQSKGPVKRTVLSKDTQTDADEKIIANAWRLIYRHETENLSLDELAGQYGFTESEAEAMYERAKSIRDLKVKNSGYRHRMKNHIPDKRRPKDIMRLSVPNLPHLSDEKQNLEYLFSKFLSAWKSNSTICQAGLKAYLRNAWKTGNDVIFHDPDKPEDAQHFLKFLSMMGIKKSQIIFISFDPEISSKYPGRWKSALELNWRNNIEQTREKSVSEFKNKWLGVRFVFPPPNASKRTDSGAKTTDSSATPVPNTTPTVALRFLMVMAAIVFMQGQDESYI
jgi:integrase